MPPPTRLLVASIGNPAPYLNTLHSAGHTVLRALTVPLSTPPLVKSRPHANGLLAHSPTHPITLWHSPSMMNISGPAVLTAFRAFQREYPGAELVVLHDELESALGVVSVRGGERGTKGHNGLRSLAKAVGGGYTRVGVGIGRPVAREGGEVARYVLRKMTGGEREALEGCVGGVMEELERLLEGGGK
ncbi:hypothetical protein VE00_06292 [Pseudogymnoascus sp. WSF 3629]|nr:hypothetical protein VE00_06292 [Pseudogymnoascus sp. WSF 3629]